LKYLLDTNVCVDYLTGRHPSVIRPRANHSRVDTLVAEIGSLDFDDDAATAYGRLRARLERSGRLMGPNDMLIAAHAMSLDLVLVSDDVAEFRRVGGLKLDNWRR
jgi:tRNA(fMet)-specific endonuclease VapC